MASWWGLSLTPPSPSTSFPHHTHQAGRNVIKSSSSLLMGAKSLAVNPKDPLTWQLLASHTKSVTDAIKSLIISIRYEERGGRRGGEGREREKEGMSWRRKKGQ